MPDITSMSPPDKIKSRLGEHILSSTEHNGEFTILIKPQSLLSVSEILKKEFGFSYLVDIGGVDLLAESPRFEVIYNLVNPGGNLRIRLKTKIEESKSEVPSVISVWPSANWHEREVFDMFGISFTGHPDLRRIYMPEDFKYFPLRKEFPLLGIPGSLPLPEKE